LHARIIIVKHEWKIVKMKNDCAKVSEVEFFDTKIFKMSFNLNLKTSCALTPHYSLELDPISSTSHYYLISCPGGMPDGSGIDFSFKITISLTTNRT
jgi:hypothetical protein